VPAVERSERHSQYSNMKLFPADPAFSCHFHNLDCVLKLVQFDFRIVQRELKGQSRFHEFNGTYTHDALGKVGDR